MEAREKCPVGIDPDRANEFLTSIGDPDRFPALKRRFPDEHLSRSLISPPNTEHGQGPGPPRCRSLAAFGVGLKADSVRQKIETAFEDLVSLSNWVETASTDENIDIRERVDIYVVGSLAGATGSGTLLDVALMAKDVCASHTPRLAGMFALPGAFEDLVRDPAQKAHLQANTYAALKELQFCLDAGRDERQEVGAIEFNYDSPAVPNLELSPHDQLFDLCLLLGNQNARGKLSGIEEFYRLMARSLFQCVSTPFRAHADSFLLASQAISGGLKCPRTNLDRSFGTISTSVLSYPAAHVAEYCTYRTAESVVQDHLIGASPSEETLRARLSYFLSNHDLEDRGDSTQLLESLLRTESLNSLDPDPKDGRPVSAEWFSLPDEYGEDLGVEEFARQIQSQQSTFSAETLPKIKTLADQNRSHRIGEPGDSQDRPLRTAVEELALSTAAEHGTRAAYQILEMLEEASIQMRTEFREKQSEWIERKKWLTRELADDANELAQVGTIKALFTSEDENLKKHLIQLYNELAEGAMWEAARSAAIQVLENLLAEAREVGSQWENLVSKLTRLRETLRTEATERETHRREAGAVVEREITRPGHARRYYQKHAPSSEEAFAVVLDACEEASGRRAALFHEALKQGATAFGEEALIDPLHDHIAPPILDTDVAEFAENNPDEVVEGDGSSVLLEGRGKDALRQALDAQAELCRPFWPALPLGPVEFEELKGIDVPPNRLEMDGNPVYSPVIDEWMETHGFRGIRSIDQREIVLTRLTMGARAFYLRPCEDWKSTYDQVDAKYEYTMHVHPALREIPDLFPDSA